MTCRVVWRSPISHDLNLGDHYDAMADLVRISLKNVQWEYRGEGNGNMVIALENKQSKDMPLERGWQSLGLVMASTGETLKMATGHVLRLVKVDVMHGPKTNLSASSDATIAEPPGGAQPVLETALMHEDTSQLSRLVAYVRDTVAPLVGRTFVHHGDVVCVSGEDLRYLNSKLRSLRPDFRKHKVLPESDCFALRLPDYCSGRILQHVSPKVHIRGPVLTVEIKPKMGFLQEVIRGADDGQPALMDSVCKYHLMQPFKLKMGKIGAVSHYCPLDLFSGCRIRGLKALKNLLRNSQNNLQIFKNGHLVFGERIKSSDSEALQEFFQSDDLERLPDQLCQLLLDALLREHAVDDVNLNLLPRRNQHVAQRCDYRKILSDWIKDDDLRIEHGDGSHICKECHLPRGCVLARLLDMQRISELDAKTLTPLYLQYKDQLDAMPMEKLQELLYGPHEQPLARAAPDTFDDAVEKIRNYLLSCTAKDCSVMITLSRIESTGMLPENAPWLLRDVNAEDVTFVHSIALVDTDWKPHARIPNHARQEEEYVRHILQSKTCE